MAAALIRPGETIALTPGTTTTEVIRGLPMNCNITVVTNTVNVAMELSKRRDVYVFVTGGHLQGEWFSLVATAALRALKNMLIIKMFVGYLGRQLLQCRRGGAELSHAEIGAAAHRGGR